MQNELSKQEQQEVAFANRLVRLHSNRIALQRDASKIRGEKLRAEVAYILDQAMINANDTVDEVMRSESERLHWQAAHGVWPQRDFVYEYSYEGSIAVWCAERSTSNAARRWLARRGYRG